MDYNFNLNEIKQRVGYYNFNLDEIRQQVGKVISYSQHLENMKLLGIDTIIDRWLTAKQQFIQGMGGNLIWEYPEPVSFELDQHAKESKLQRFADLAGNHYNNMALEHFLSLLRVDDFFANRTSREYYIQPNLTIPENFKVVKAFKFFETNEDVLKELQSEASRIIQENIVSGTLCLSVHPLDFLSASENVHNWRSCHALDGDFRSGNLNYLMDKGTVICYLRAEKNAILPHFPESIPWNSKKWRVWLFFSTDTAMLFAGRQYPFEAQHGLDIIKDQILPQINLDNWTSFSKDKIRSHVDSVSGEHFHFNKLIPISDVAIPITTLVQNGKNTYHYNDLLNSHSYDPVYSYRYDSSFEKIYGNAAHLTDMHSTRFILGEECPCPICGKHPIDCGELMICDYCNREMNDNEDYAECDICGEETFYQDLIELPFSDARVCRKCYTHELKQCQVCGMKDLPEYIRYRDYDPRCLCEECYNNLTVGRRIPRILQF